MPEFYNSSPATKYFIGDAFVLRGSRKQDPDTREWTFDEATLHMTFDVVRQSMNLSVFDDKTRKYTHEFKSSKPKDVDAFLRKVEKDYKRMVPATYFTRAAKFLELAPQGFGVELDLDAHLDFRDRYCEQCGDTNSNEIAAYYFPAIGKRPASVGVKWDIGCYDGDMSDGAKVDTIDSVLEIISRALTFAQDEDKAELQAFVDKLKAIV